jgi:hypothetical protein
MHPHLLAPTVVASASTGINTGRTRRDPRSSPLEESEDIISLGTVMSLGWIPYVGWWRHLPPNGFPAYVKRYDPVGIKKLALKSLFWTGNPQPPISIFGSRSSFFRYLKRKEFRGAICVPGITADASDPSQPKFSWDKIPDYEMIGYTAVRVPPGLRWWRRFSLFLQGECGDGTTWTPVLATADDPDTLVMLQRVEFRVGGLLRRMAALPFGVQMPYAWMVVVISVNFKTQVADISVRHSAVPSIILARCYDRGDPEYHAGHDMPAIDASSVRGFFESRSPMPPEYV